MATSEELVAQAGSYFPSQHPGRDVGHVEVGSAGIALLWVRRHMCTIRLPTMVDTLIEDFQASFCLRLIGIELPGRAWPA